MVKPGGASGVQSPLGSSALHDETREDVYILYEEEEEEEEKEGEGQWAGQEERANGETLNPNFIRCKLTIVKFHYPFAVIDLLYSISLISYTVNFVIL